MVMMPPADTSWQCALLSASEVVALTAPTRARARRRQPPEVESRAELEVWMCSLHNSVNRKLDKPEFNCAFVSSRWQPLDCDAADACTLAGR